MCADIAAEKLSALLVSTITSSSLHLLAYLQETEIDIVVATLPARLRTASDNIGIDDHVRLKGFCSDLIPLTSGRRQNTLAITLQSLLCPGIAGMLLAANLDLSRGISGGSQLQIVVYHGFKSIPWDESVDSSRCIFSQTTCRWTPAAESQAMYQHSCPTSQ